MSDVIKMIQDRTAKIEDATKFFDEQIQQKKDLLNSEFLEDAEKRILTHEIFQIERKTMSMRSLL